ncbi:transglutaminase family protein [Mesorhizobium sp. KR9-304]|uniref:transglutaminase family protein n=1 Tax=Mesorhizobium sp. KR9-304 TaxID=3156614 RepID=UPI0032B3346D
MLYDIKLHLHYDYAAAAGGSRHHVHVAPQTIAGVQRVVASSLSFSPVPTERSDFLDFFGNAVTSVASRSVYDALDIRMSARVSVTRPEPSLDVSPKLADLADEIGSVRSLKPDAPHHFLAASDFVDLDPGITAYARESQARGASVTGVANDFCNRIYNDFAYDGEATTVATKAADAFALKRGVCQDFTHVMIAGLRGLGIPAGYVSGFLRTIPPPSKERLEGADAMHAWVKVWCGREAGWQEFDPTNGMRASNDHITVGYGRDYADVAPIVGVLRTTGSHTGEQAVDVIPVA